MNSGFTIEAMVKQWREPVQDPGFPAVRQWKERTGGKAIGYFPVYTPVELIYAAGFLPVAITGAGNKLEISNADARFGSFICSIVKSTMELAMRENLNVLDGMLFTSICDSARNLAALFQRNFAPKLFVDYIHFPQNNSSAAAIDYLTTELERIKDDLEKLSGRTVRSEDISRAISLYNENRRLIKKLYSFRSEYPNLLSTCELYVLLKAGTQMPPEEHSALLMEVLEHLPGRSVKPRDRIRVVIEGSYCEQPPLDLIQSLEEAGCYVVEDDLLLGTRWFVEDVPLNKDPIYALSESYLTRSTYSSVRHDDRLARPLQLVKRIETSGANAVIFCIAKFCEPAFFDYVLFKDEMDKRNIPHLLVEFEEKMWTFEKARTEVETFVESLLFD